MGAIVVYRIQDRDGRGPFKPGRSHLWSDTHFQARELLPPWGDEFGWDLIERRGRPGEHFGTAVRSLDGLNAWFSPTEQQRLRRMGYLPVCLWADRVLAESRHQLVFTRRLPLALEAVICPWPAPGLMLVM
jgi:hypothetical protein